MAELPSTSSQLSHGSETSSTTSRHCQPPLLSRTTTISNPSRWICAKNLAPISSRASTRSWGRSKPRRRQERPSRWWCSPVLLHAAGWSIGKGHYRRLRILTRRRSRHHGRQPSHWKQLQFRESSPSARSTCGCSKICGKHNNKCSNHSSRPHHPSHWWWHWCLWWGMCRLGMLGFDLCWFRWDLVC